MGFAQVWRAGSVVETKLKSRRVWLIAAVAAVFGVSLWLAWTPQLSEMKRLEQEVGHTNKKWKDLRAGNTWASPFLLMDRSLGRANQNYYISVIRGSLSNLLIKGYYVRKQVELMHRTDAMEAFQIWAMTRRTNDGIESCTSVSNSTVLLFVRSNSLPAWEALVREFDRPGAK